MKRLLSLLLVFCIALSVMPMTVSAAKNVEITLWTYTIGGWGDCNDLQKMVTDFETANPNISVKIECLDYMNGDDKVNTAIEAGCTPDIIMEGPERLVSNWGARGLMVDLSEMIDSTDEKEIYASFLNSCYGKNGALYEYPLCGTVHVMAINKTVFEEAGAMKYINTSSRTWKSTEDFYKAIETVYEYTGQNVAAIYCGGQGGDQGTRALLTNLSNTNFTDSTNSYYTWNSTAMANTLSKLRQMDGIEFDSGLVGGDEIWLLYQGYLNMAFCWNITQQKDPYGMGTGAGRTLNGDEIMFLAFPSDSTPRLQGGIWGFGVFDNGDTDKINAAKTFVKYMCDSKATADAVRLSGYFPVRTSAAGKDLSQVWSGDEIRTEYQKLMPLMGQYSHTTPNWAQARTAWWSMLWDIGYGADIKEMLSYWNDFANEGLNTNISSAVLAKPKVSISNVASTGKIKLTWDKIAGAQKYKVYRATSENGTYKLIKTTTGTSYTDKDTTAGKTYYYKVKAIAENAAADSAYSAVKSRTCDLARPEITLSNVASTGKIKVTWKAIDGAVEYEVYRSASKNGTYKLMKTTTGTSYTNTGAETGNTYYYKVKAIAETSAANSAYSEIKSRTCDLARPEVTLSNVASSGKIKVSWKKIDGAVEYEVYRATSKDGTYKVVKTTTSTSYTDKDAKAGKTYYYKVKAIAKKSAADSAYSNVKYRTCDLAQPDVSITRSSGKPKVSWGNVSGAEKYTVYRATSKSGNYSSVKTTTSLSYTDTKATAGKTYYYKVIAVCSNTSGNSDYSKVVSISATK